MTIQGVLDVPSEELNSIIGAVGFHNKKTIFMKQVAEICKTKYHGDIPSTAEELIALPGVGPKMVRARFFFPSVRRTTVDVRTDRLLLDTDCAFIFFIGLFDTSMRLE